MCDSWKIPPGRELTVEEAGRVFADVGRLDVVRLSGGEPFLRKDLPDLAEAVLAAADPMVIHITTNGSLTDRAVELARSFSRPKRLRIMVSFDGLPATHDANRGPGVTFERAFETVARLTELARRRPVRVTANHTVISSDSMADAAALRDRLAELGVDVQSVLAYADSAMYGAARVGGRAEDLVEDGRFPLHPDLDAPAAADFAAAELERVGKLGDWQLRMGKRYYLSGMVRRLKGRPVRPGRPRCVALRSHLRLLPDGSVPVCQFNTEVVGNLLESGFEDVWRGDRAAGMRQWVDRCPGCWAECEVIPNALYSGDLLLSHLEKT
jgi:MoaA/NifB/PqqE/SkfB family radical SAM enzyme